jgi:hypothetical protein
VIIVIVESVQRVHQPAQIFTARPGYSKAWPLTNQQELRAFCHLLPDFRKKKVGLIAFARKWRTKEMKQRSPIAYVFMRIEKIQVSGSGKSGSERSVKSWFRRRRTASKMAAVVLVLVSFSNRLAAQTVTASISSFGVTNYTSYVLAGDTGSGGRQAIRTQTVMTYTNGIGPSQTYDFQLVYSLLDSNNAPFPIFDETGQSNIVYTVSNTVTLPTTVTTLSRTNAAPLRPWLRLDPYGTYTPNLEVYSRPHNSGDFTDTGTNAIYGPVVFYDFTNTVSPDASPNLLVTLSPPVLSQTFAIAGSPGQGGFPLYLVAFVQRYDDWTLPPRATNTTVTFNFQLLDLSASVSIPLQSAQAAFNLSVQSHDSSTPPNPTFATVSTNFQILPAQQIDSVDDQFQIVVTLTHTEGSTVITDYIYTNTPPQLLAFNGQLLFGPMTNYFTNLDNAPTITATVPGDHLDCLLPVTPNAGLLPGAPGYTFGDGSPIPVSFFTNGTAQVKPGVVVPIHGPSPSTFTVQNISYQLSGLRLTQTGAVGSVTLDLPLGFSVFQTNGGGVIAQALTRLTTNTLTFANVMLNAQLAPSNSTLTFTAGFLGIEETLPYWFFVRQLTWQINAGQLLLTLNTPMSGLFVRQTEDDLLTSMQSALAQTNAANRISNDGYYRNALAMGNTVTITADANGVALVSGQIALRPPELRPHFPYSGSAPGVRMPVSTGQLFITNSLVASNSFIDFTNLVPVLYARDCADTNCSGGTAGPATLSFTNVAGQFSFTPDGGLLGYGSVPTTGLTWGYIHGSYAQQAFNVQTGVYEMAGTFLRYDQSGMDPTNRPAVILLSGFGDATNPGYIERLGDFYYPTGAANYAGLNFRAPTNGQSFVAQQNYGPYLLTPRSKYYARYGGISGIHEALTVPVVTPQFYGYDFSFSTYRLSYLDSEVWESRTDGQITFPKLPLGPAGFTNYFEDMRFSCLGDILSAQLPAGGGITNHLDYWNVDFTPQSIQFKPTNTDICGTGNRCLVIGAEMKLPFIPEALHAALGFKPNGNLATPSDDVQGCDSRFAVPAQLSLQGPGISFFPLSTAAEGYFNNWATQNSPSDGFYNLAGRFRVPFFQDIEAHLHVTPISKTSSIMAIMGGWPYPGSQATNLGWSVNGGNYFNTVTFDPTSDGWPASQVSITDYENSSSTQYRARAQQDWIEVAFFDYPLKWDAGLREFAGWRDAPVDLPILSVNSRLKQLTPGKVDFDFAQDLSLPLPSIKVLDLLNDAVGEVNGPLSSVSTAIATALPGVVFDTTGLNELQHVLREDPQTFLQPVLDANLAPVVSQLYNSFTNLSQSDPNFLSEVASQVVFSQLSSALGGLNGTVGQANSVLGQVNQALSDAQRDVGILVQALAKDNNGNRQAFRAIVRQLLADQGPALGASAGAISGIADSYFDEAIANIGPELDDLQSQLQDVQNQLGQLQAGLTGGAFAQALSEVSGDGNTIGQVVQAAGTDLSNLYASVVGPSGDYFTANPTAAQQAILQQLRNAFFSSPIPANYQQTVRQFLFDQNAALDQLADALFDQVNSAMRDALGQIPDVSDILKGATDGLQAMKAFTGAAGAAPQNPPALASAKIRGAPTFNGDSLRKIHLDAKVQINIPDQMEFDAFMEIKELDSQSVPVDCVLAGAPAAEVTLGANNVNLDWVGLPSLTLSADAKWTLQANKVMGLGGSLDIKGTMGFHGFSLNEIGVDLAFGATENYFAGKAAGTIPILGIPVDAQAGLFVGKACSMDPLTFIDPHASDVLQGATGFAGVYLEYGAGLSLSEILFGTSSCFLDAEASETVATYYDGGMGAQKLGMQQTASVDLSLLCLISGSATLSVGASVSPSSQDCHPPGLPNISNLQLNLDGSVQICGSLGYCPFCVSGCKGMGFHATVTPPCVDNKSGNLDLPTFNFNLDY